MLVFLPKYCHVIDVLCPSIIYRFIDGDTNITLKLHLQYLRNSYSHIRVSYATTFVIIYFHFDK